MSTVRPNGAPAAPSTAGQQPTPTTQNPQNDPTNAQPVLDASGEPVTEPQAPTDVTNPAAQRAAQEAAAYRTKLRDAEKRIAEFEAAQKAAEDAKLSEVERYKKQLTEAQAERDRVTTQTQERVVRAEVRSVARELGIKPELALRLMDYAALTFDDNGDPANISDLLTQAAQDYSIPLASATTPAAPTAPAPTPRPSAGAPAAPARSATQGGNGLTRDAITNMSPLEYQQRREEVQNWLRQHPNG